MTTLILSNEVIVAASSQVQTTDIGFITPEAVYPFNANITGAVEVENLPDDFRPDLYIWVDGTLERIEIEPTPAVEPVPEQVTAAQLRRALRRSDLLDSFNGAVAAKDAEIHDEWEYGTVFARDSGFISQVFSVLELTDAEIDDIFRLAATIN